MPSFSFSRKVFSFFAATVLAAALLLPGSSPASAQFRKGPDSIADLSEKLIDTVVNISTSQRVSRNQAVQMPAIPPDSPFKDFFEDFFNRQQQEQQKNGKKSRDLDSRVSSLGSGFVIDASGIVITNNHVVEAADEITVIFHDGSKLKAKLLGRDSKIDIAVLKVDAPKPLLAAKFGDSDKARIGEWVMAIGNPFGLGGSVTAGIISARNRDIQAGPYDDFIQTDTAINRGNSGGPLFNMDGEVIGINTAIISPGGGGGSVGISFAVPSNLAQAVIAQIQQYGETRRGWLGVRITTVTDEFAESLGLTSVKGALVGDVTEDGPAKKAGIQPGDVILKFNGRTIDSPRELSRAVADSKIDTAVPVVVFRKQKEQTLQVQVGRLDEKEGSEAKSSDKKDQNDDAAPQPKGKELMGLSLSELTPKLRGQYQIDKDVKGVLITGVDDDSIANERRVQPGDTIVEVSQEPVAKPDDIEKRFADLKKQGRKSALLLLANIKGELRFVTLPLKGDE
ncbi:MAG: Do family serine endopeptidase [Pseudomonadota bacterium]